MSVDKNSQTQSDIQIYQSKWYLKYFDSFFAAATVIVVITYLFDFLPSSFNEYIFNSTTLYFLYVNSFWLFALLFAIGYSIYWHKKEGKNPSLPSLQRHAFLRAVLRYGFSFVIAEYGFTKVLGIQFYLGINWQDMPVSELNGFFLTWYYFYFSRPIVLIIAFFEIGGAVLLLFRRSTLLGAFILLPVLANITLTDYFYKVPGVVFEISFFLSSGLIYMILLHWEKLRQLFFNKVDIFPKINNKSLSNLLRFAILIIAFLSNLQWVTPWRKEKVDTLLQGKWKVNEQVVNGKPIPLHAWENDTSVSVWSSLYVEDGWFTVSTNPYYFDPKKAKFAHYTYDSQTQALKVIFSGEKGEKENFQAIVDSLNGEKMVIKGILRRDTIALTLTRVKPVKTYRVYWDW